MTIDFGRVQRYIDDRGFGFVTHTFAKVPAKEVFFHIKAVKRTHPELAAALGSNTSSTIYFWYEYSISPKGQEVTSLLDIKRLRQQHAEDTAAFLDTINASWMNVEKSISESIRQATVDLFTPDEVNQLAERRVALEAEHRKHKEEQQKAEAARLQAIAEQRAAEERDDAAKRQAIRDQEAAQERIEEEEFSLLVAEMKPLNYTRSSQVSEYISHKKLGLKYKNISGLLEMELDDRRWIFNGGFPKDIYARLCKELELGNDGSRAKPVKFTPYKDVRLPGE